MKLRKLLSCREEVVAEGGKDVTPLAHTTVVLAVIAKPWHGRGFVADLQPVIDEVAPELGKLLAGQVVELLGMPVEAYGKAGIVGIDGEIEHASGLIHTLRFGDFFRQAANATTLLPAAEKRAPAGQVFDIALKHITDATVRSHHQTVEARVPDAPRADEIVVGLAAAEQSRPQARFEAFPAGS